jgi:hypothetical protein
VMMNAYHEDLDFRIPSLATPMSWEPLVDTSQPTGRVTGGTHYAPGDVYRLQAHSFALFINRAPRQELPRGPAFASNIVPSDRIGPAENDRVPYNDKHA